MPQFTNDLTGRQLDAMVAEALDLHPKFENGHLLICNSAKIDSPVVACPYFTLNASETLAFMDSERLQPMFQLNGEGKGSWACSVAGSFSIWAQGATLAEAACRCLITKKFGDQLRVPPHLQEVAKNDC
ncbi:hypothetical protein [Comamonas thiooxydans]|uniref:hypothetical protein n=1 Tax=Comamonas thiooxydans TaxID=363952 RepID=UPI000B419BC1|nr:hypothetical protein [Comamonas thiooxydans]